MPEKIKLELKTTLEKFFMGIMILSFVLIFVGFSQMNTTHSPAIFVSAIFTFFLSFILYFATDNYYLLDLKKRALIYRFKFLFFERLSKVVDFSGIHAVTVNISQVTAKGKTSYFYVATLVLFNGKVLPVSDIESEKSAVQKLAEYIARVSGAQYVQSFGTSAMMAAKSPGGRYTFKPKLNVTTAAEKIMIQIGAVIMILVGIPFIAMVFYHFIKGR